jgi:cephalosporin hydroxylase
MRITIDTDKRELTVQNGSVTESVPLYSRRAFEVISREWVNVGWNEKYVYTFSWLGRPVIQLPEDLIRVQEAIDRVKPDVLIETGVAHGGSLIFYATLFAATGRGRVIGVDIEIRPGNRRAIENHLLSRLITLIEGDSISQTVVETVRSQVSEHERVMVILDSNHTKEHVLSELDMYAPLVTPGSYIVATDGVMEELAGVPRGHTEWTWDNPAGAAREFAAVHPEFVIEQPEWPFNESALRANVTHWPSAWLRRLA